MKRPEICLYLVNRGDVEVNENEAVWAATSVRRIDPGRYNLVWGNANVTFHLSPDHLLTVSISGSKDGGDSHVTFPSIGEEVYLSDLQRRGTVSLEFEPLEGRSPVQILVSNKTCAVLEWHCTPPEAYAFEAANLEYF